MCWGLGGGVMLDSAAGLDTEGATFCMFGPHIRLRLHL